MILWFCDSVILWFCDSVILWLCNYVNWIRCTRLLPCWPCSGLKEVSCHVLCHVLLWLLYWASRCPKNAPQLFTINKRPKVNSTHFLLFSRVHEILSKLACQSVCPLVSFSIHPSMTFANSSFYLPIYKDIFKWRRGLWGFRGCGAFGVVGLSGTRENRDKVHKILLVWMDRKCHWSLR